MLPIRKSLPVPRRAPAIAVEVRVPAFGTWFAAIAATVRPEGMFLSTFQEVPKGTRVEVQIALPGGPPIDVAGVVSEHPIEGVGIDIAFDDLDAASRDRLRDRDERLAPVSEIRTRVA